MNKEILPASLSEAIKTVSKFYFTNKPCVKGHLSKRLTINSNCYECILLNKAEQRRKLKEIFKTAKDSNFDKS